MEPLYTCLAQIGAWDPAEVSNFGGGGFEWQLCIVLWRLWVGLFSGFLVVDVTNSSQFVQTFLFFKLYLGNIYFCLEPLELLAGKMWDHFIIWVFVLLLNFLKARIWSDLGQIPIKLVEIG